MIMKTTLRQFSRASVTCAAALVAGIAWEASCAQTIYRDYYFTEAVDGPSTTVFFDSPSTGELLDAFDFGASSVVPYGPYAELQDRFATGQVYASANAVTYWVGVESSIEQYGRNGTAFNQVTQHRRCADDSWMDLVISELRLVGFDAGPDDYDAARESLRSPNLDAWVEMSVIALSLETSRFFESSGIASLKFFAAGQDDQRWRFDHLNLGDSASDFWYDTGNERRAQFELVRTPDVTPIATGDEAVTYRLAAPHRVRIDLSAVDIAPACPDLDEPQPPGHAGEFYVVVNLQASAKVKFASPIELSAISAFMRDPQSPGGAAEGLIVESEGIQTLDMEPDEEQSLPAGTILIPDPDCEQP